MTVSSGDRGKITAVVNKYITAFLKAIKYNEVRNYCGGKNDPLVITSKTIYSNLFNAIINNIFKKFAPSCKENTGAYYHYKSFAGAFEIIKSGKILASALSNYQKDTEDVKEFEYLFRTLHLKNQNYVDNEKENNYIFCLTKENKDNKFWEEYTRKEDAHTGLCIEFNITVKDVNCFDFRNLCYDKHNLFAELGKMVSNIHNNVNGQYFFIDGITHFAAYYKNPDYEWEKESRLLFNAITFQKNYKKLNFVFTNKQRVGMKYLEIPLNNELFELKIKKVIMGRNISKKDKTKLLNLTRPMKIKCVMENSFLLLLMFFLEII